jgi:hypothetical protein
MPFLMGKLEIIYLTWHDEHISVLVSVVSPVTCSAVTDGKPWRLIGD